MIAALFLTLTMCQESPCLHKGAIYVYNFTICTGFLSVPWISSGLEVPWQGQKGKARFAGSSEYTKWLIANPCLPTQELLCCLYSATVSEDTGRKMLTPFAILYLWNFQALGMVGSSWLSFSCFRCKCLQYNLNIFKCGIKGTESMLWGRQSRK